MGSKLPCQFCGKDSGMFGGRTIYRCTNCGTVLCNDHIEEKLLKGKLLFAWSPAIFLIIIFILCTNIPCNLGKVLDQNTKNIIEIIIFIIIFIVQPIFWGTINWTKKICTKCGAENTLKTI